MKVHQWIDKYNSQTSFKILTKYNSGRASGKSGFYALNFTFWPQYIIRLLLVISSAVTLKKDAYQALADLFSTQYSSFYSPAVHTVIYIKLCDMVATLFGYRYFVPAQLLPLKDSKHLLQSRLSIKPAENPLVTVIISTRNQLDYLFNCLQSVIAHTAGDTIEIIIADDCSTDHTADFFKHNTSGILYLSTTEISGKGQSLQHAVKYAKGQLLCFLNSTVQVQTNWLPPLLHILEDQQAAGVTAKVIYANGLLKQAGAVRQENGTLTNYGSYAHPDHPYYNYIRETAISDQDCILIRKDDYIQGGISAAGRKFFYQPLSGVIASGDHDHTPILPSAQEHDLLKQIRSSENRRTVLFIDNSMPTPDKDSGSNRLFKIMKMVRSLGYHVMFLPNDGRKNGHYAAQMIAEGFEVLYSFPNRRGMLKILENLSPYLDFVWLCKTDNTSLYPLIAEHNKNCRWIYDTIDLHFLRFQREAELTGEAAILQLAAATKRAELEFAGQVDCTIAITEDERTVLENEGISNVIVIPNVHESIPQPESIPEFSERSGLLFIGGYYHKPNIDAANWLVREIMPEIWKINPSIKLTLLGSNPSPEILSFSSENVAVPGYVPDVSAYFYSHRVFIAPLRYGAGMKGKVGQSLEYGLPVVSTSIGVEGMNLRDGMEALVAEDTAGLVTGILRLYDSAELWNRLRTNSSAAIEQYSPKNITAKLKHLFEMLENIQ